MIIRILGDGQFRLDDNLVDRINKIDNKIVNHVSQGQQSRVCPGSGQFDIHYQGTGRAR